MFTIPVRFPLVVYTCSPNALYKLISVASVSLIAMFISVFAGLGYTLIKLLAVLYSVIPVEVFTVIVPEFKFTGIKTS
jgi:hypothetical protein